MNAAAARQVPQGSAGKTGRSVKAEMDAARERMRGLGLGCGEIAAELARCYRLRPRKAYRLAYGWSLTEAAARFNARAASEGTDPAGRASMTGPHLCEYEQWPHGGRKPSVYLLLLLAKVYGTGVLDLLDCADHETLAPADRLIFQHTINPPAHGGASLFGADVGLLLAARGWSLRDLARRVPCDAGYLSKLINGQARPSRTLAVRLEELLGAQGRLLAHLPARQARVNGGGSQRTAAAEAPAPAAGSISVTLPYVPGRLVIEVSGLDSAPATAAQGEPALRLVPTGPDGTRRRGHAG